MSRRARRFHRPLATASIGVALGVAAVLAAVLMQACARPPAVVESAAVPSSPPPAERSRSRMHFDATAYSVTGKTASGVHTRRGIVAADPATLPIGSRIRVHGAQQYSGVYVVADTGRAIDGREIDIYMPNPREARRFGRRRVEVEVLEYGRRKVKEAHAVAPSPKL